jgi:hypothetical protein
MVAATMSNTRAKRLFGAALAVPALVVLVALAIDGLPGLDGRSPIEAPAQPLTGSFTLWAASPRANPCEPRSEAPDIHAGAPVDVKDASEAVIAGTTLGEGAPDATNRGCVFPFRIARLPVADEYTVQVGARTGVTYPKADVAGTGWRIDLNLGLPDPAASAAPAA